MKYNNRYLFIEVVIQNSVYIGIFKQIIRILWLSVYCSQAYSYHYVFINSPVFRVPKRC